MIWDRISAYNRGRDPERLALKYRKMAGDELAFLRGSAHLMYEDWPADAALRKAPAAWICGDLHLENFGTYRADNRLTYFDCNDFDEGCLGPVTWDLGRLLISLAIECEEREYKPAAARRLMSGVVEAYAAQLRLGKPRWVEPETSAGIIRELFDGLQLRTAQKFLNSRTVMDKRRRRINTENGKALPASENDQEAVKSFFKRETVFVCVDAARRIAGNGSLGLPRFVALVEDKKGYPFLLDLKHAQPAAPLLCENAPAQPPFRDNAERIVTAQGLFLAMPPAFLQAVRFAGDGWVLRELLPSEDRVDVSRAPEPAFVEYVATLGAVTAWGHLRASGWKGAANGDTLVDWDIPGERLVEFAIDYARSVSRCWKEFRENAPLAG